MSKYSGIHYWHSVYVLPVGVVMYAQAIEYNEIAFQTSPLLYHSEKFQHDSNSSNIIFFTIKSKIWMKQAIKCRTLAEDNLSDENATDEGDESDEVTSDEV